MNRNSLHTYNTPKLTTTPEAPTAPNFMKRFPNTQAITGCSEKRAIRVM
jgi:hypothetical protein